MIMLKYIAAGIFLNCILVTHGNCKILREWNNNTFDHLNGDRFEIGWDFEDKNIDLVSLSLVIHETTIRFSVFRRTPEYLNNSVYANKIRLCVNSILFEEIDWALHGKEIRLHIMSYSRSRNITSDEYIFRQITVNVLPKLKCHDVKLIEHDIYVINCTVSSFPQSNMIYNISSSLFLVNSTQIVSDPEIHPISVTTILTVFDVNYQNISFVVFEVHNQIRNRIFLNQTELKFGPQKIPGFWLDSPIIKANTVVFMILFFVILLDVLLYFLTLAGNSPNKKCIMNYSLVPFNTQIATIYPAPIEKTLGVMNSCRRSFLSREDGIDRMVSVQTQTAVVFEQFNVPDHYEDTYENKNLSPVSGISDNIVFTQLAEHSDDSNNNNNNQNCNKMIYKNYDDVPIPDIDQPNETQDGDDDDDELAYITKPPSNKYDKIEKIDYPTIMKHEHYYKTDYHER